MDAQGWFVLSRNFHGFITVLIVQTAPSDARYDIFFYPDYSQAPVIFSYSNGQAIHSSGVWNCILYVYIDALSGQSFCIEATSEPGNPNTGISLSFVAFAESSENEGAYFPVPEEGEALRALSQELPAQSSISDPSIAVRARFPVRELPPSLTLRTLMAPPLARPRSAGSRFRLTPLID